MSVAPNYLVTKIKAWSYEISDDISSDGKLFGKIVEDMAKKKLIPAALRPQIEAAKTTSDRTMAFVAMKNALTNPKHADVKGALGNYMADRKTSILKDMTAAETSQNRKATVVTAVKVALFAGLMVLTYRFNPAPMMQQRYNQYVQDQIAQTQVELRRSLDAFSNNISISHPKPAKLPEVEKTPEQIEKEKQTEHNINVLQNMGKSMEQLFKKNEAEYNARQEQAAKQAQLKPVQNPPSTFGMGRTQQQSARKPEPKQEPSQLPRSFRNPPQPTSKPEAKPEPKPEASKAPAAQHPPVTFRNTRTQEARSVYYCRDKATGKEGFTKKPPVAGQPCEFLPSQKTCTTKVEMDPATKKPVITGRSCK